MSSSQATQDKSPVGAVCPRFHRAVELIGRRWTGAILRTLMGGPLRFNEVLACIPGISDRLLTERLRELEAAEILSREVQPGSPVRVSYRLTPRGSELEPVMRELGIWAERWIGVAE